MTTAVYQAKLDTGDFKGSTDDAVKAIQGMQRSLKSDQEELRATATAMRSLKGAAVVDTAAFAELDDRLKSVKQRIADNTAALTKLNVPLKESKKAGKKLPLPDGKEELKGFGETIKGFAGELKYFGGPLGSSAARVENWGKLATGGQAAAAGLAVGVVAAGAAAAYGAKKFFDLAVSSAEARRNEELQLASLATLADDGFGQAAVRGAEAQAAIDAVSRTSSQGRDKLVGYAAQLLEAGLSGDEFQTSLQGVALAADVQGEAAAGAFAKTAIATNKAGKSVDVLYRKLDAKLGKQAQAKLLATAASAERLESNIGHLFDGLKVDGLLAAQAAFNDMFDVSSSSGKILHELAVGLGDTLVGAAKSFAVASVVSFKGALTIGQKFHTLLSDLKIKWLDLKIVADELGWSRSAKGAKSYDMGGRPQLEKGESYVHGIPSVKKDVSYTRGTLDLRRPVSDAPVDIYGNPLKTGAAIAKGVAEGMRDAAPAVAASAQGLAATADTAFREATDTHSPSRLFRKHGRSLVDGLRLGIRDGRADLDADVTGLARSQPAASGSAGVGPTNVTNTFHMTYNIVSTEPKAVAAEISAIMVSDLRRVALQRAVP